MQRKAKCWSFIITSFTEDDITRLSNLSPLFFAYSTFSVCNDEAGNQFLQGFVRTHKRNCIALLYREIKENALYDIPQVNDDIFYVLTTIQLSKYPKEFGSAEKSHFKGYLKELKKLRRDITSGKRTPEKLSRQFPRICFHYPNIVTRFMKLSLELSPPSPEIILPRHDEIIKHWVNDEIIKHWVNPPDLAQKVRKASVKGRTYKPSKEEWKEKSSARLLCPKPLKEMFESWIKEVKHQDQEADNTIIRMVPACAEPHLIKDAVFSSEPDPNPETSYYKSS